MNVLILTPDRVGSTLLQRLFTVYANLNENYIPVTVNLHELTNGLAKYHNEKFGIEMLGKKEGSWGYHQNLGTIVDLLKSCNHDVVSRLAYYHLKNRKDSINDQLDFYKFLNENFYIVAARRKNLFEHALSWAISVESKKLNVYSHQEKYEVFKNMQQHGVTLQQDVLEKYLNQYLEYIDWVDRHFSVNKYFEYERDLNNIEEFILGCSPFKNNNRPLNWSDRFNISWTDWNRMHYLLSLVPFDTQFSQEDSEFIEKNLDEYTRCRVFLQDLQDDGILVSGIPIKLHTLHEKSKLITNTPQCLEFYNNWATTTHTEYALTYEPETLAIAASTETGNWFQGVTANNLIGNHVSKIKLLSADLKSD
jgi:hypothetical protein